MDAMRNLGFPYDAKEDGSCVMLDENNKCKVYDKRPDACNVDKMYDRFHSNVKTKKEIYLLEATICNSFVEQDGIDNKYLIDLKQYQ